MRDIKPLFIPTQNSGVTWWRFYNFVNAGFYERAMDAHLMWWQKNLNEIHPWQVDLLTPEYRARILNEMDVNVRKADIVVMGMVHTPAGLDMLMGIREMYGLPVVMELDDNILSTPDYNPASECYAPGSKLRELAIRQMREADALIVSTPYLKQIYSEFNDHIYVMPNSIDFDLWGKANRERTRGRIVIGWAGGASHNDDLAIIEPVVDRIVAKYPQVLFKFIHGISPSLRGKKGVKHIAKWAASADYPRHIAKQGFDIGIAPLVDNAFNRGKSNLRWLETGALGVPCVASNVGHFRETIRHGVDGLLCDTQDDFFNALEELIVNKEKRREIGRAAYSRVYDDFNVKKTCVKYADALYDIVERGQIKRAVPVYKDSNFKMEGIQI